jgi:hypothetical protein
MELMLKPTKTSGWLKTLGELVGASKAISDLRELIKKMKVCVEF